MRRSAIVLMVAAALALPAAAQAGGWATVDVRSDPEGTRAGEAWVAELEVLQHGVTPLDGVRPRVLIEGPDGETQAFGATPTGEPGVYRAQVTFPSGGTWRYAVDDGFTRTHRFDPVTIDDATPSAAAASGGAAGWVVGVGVVVGLSLLAALVLLARRAGWTPPRGAR